MPMCPPHVGSGSSVWCRTHARARTQLLGWRMCLCLDVLWCHEQQVGECPGCVVSHTTVALADTAFTQLRWLEPATAASSAMCWLVCWHAARCCLVSPCYQPVTACVVLVYVHLRSMPCHAVVALSFLPDLSWLYYYLHCPQQHPCSCREPALCCVCLLPAGSQPFCGGPRCPCSVPCFLFCCVGLYQTPWACHPHVAVVL